MIAKQSVFLNLERDKALPEGHEDAKFLLVRAGQEIAEAELEKYEGAADLAETELEVKEQPVIPPPNLKQHGQEEGDGSIPAPKIKDAPADQESDKTAAPQSEIPSNKGKLAAKAKRSPKLKK